MKLTVAEQVSSAMGQESQQSQQSQGQSIMPQYPQMFPGGYR